MDLATQHTAEGRAHAPGGGRGDAPNRRVRRLPPRSPVTGRVSPSSAVIARPLLVLLPVLTFLAPALFLALVRAPTYTAESRLLVGGFDVRAQAVPGFVEAARTLASTYSRLVSTRVIEEPVSVALGLPPGEVNTKLSATAVPESSIIRVMGKSKDRDEAVRLADAAAEALVEYTAGSGGAADTEAALAEYEEAARSLRIAQGELAAAETALDVAQANGSGSSVATAREALADAQATASGAALREQALGARYTDLLAERERRSSVDIISPAADVTSDRRSVLQIAIAGPVLLGLVVGVALATVLVNRQTDVVMARAGRATH